MEINKIIQGDCLEVMKGILDGSIDMILCDLPYNVTEFKWDGFIPFDKLWIEYERIITNTGAIVLTACQPFTSHLILSNPSLFKYTWVWIKNEAFNFVHCKNAPMRKTEDVCIFSKGKIKHRGQSDRMVYNPQGLIPFNKKVCGLKKGKGNGKSFGISRPSFKEEYIQEFTNYPSNILEFGIDFKERLHPTQKPVALFEYLIKTYTNEGELVLDNCIGSGTTAIAYINTNRNYIGIEKKPEYVEIARKRIRIAENRRTEIWF